MAGEPHAQLLLHEVHRRQGDDEQALEALRLSLCLFRRADQPLGEARALIQLGHWDRQHGRLRTAEARMRQALRLLRVTGSHLWEVRARTALGDVLADLDQRDEARAEREAALEVHTSTDGPERDELRARLGRAGREGGPAPASHGRSVTVAGSVLR